MNISHYFRKIGILLCICTEFTDALLYIQHESSKNTVIFMHHRLDQQYLQIKRR